ncbi:hypothetical protein JXR93_11580 [bacterium]|nr:hypothetical protein [bacterium]
MIFLSCSDNSSFWIPIDKECSYDSDCSDDMRCLANICISKTITNSDTKFSIKITPQNSSSNDYYYLPIKTEKLTIEELENNKNSLFKIQTVPKTEITGLITNNKNIKMSYQISAQSESNSSLLFTTRSYEEDGKTYYQFKVPIDSYKITIYPEKIYPPYTFTISNLEALSIYNSPIQLDQYYFETNGYKKIYGVLEYYLGEQKNYLNDANIYAYTIDNSGKEILISNKTLSCNQEIDSNCKKSGYFSLLVPSSLENLFLKITTPTFPNTSFTYSSSLSGENIGNITIGNFTTFQDISINFEGDCGNLEGIKVDITGMVGFSGVYKNSFYTTCSNCSRSENTIFKSDIQNIRLIPGTYTISAKTPSNSCYASLSKENKIDLNNNEITISLENKRVYQGKVLNHLNEDSTYSPITFQKQNISGFASETEVITDSNGNFEVMLEDGIYNILIKSTEQQDNSATTVMFYQNFNSTTNRYLTFNLSEGYKTLLSLSDINLNPIGSAVVSLYIENLSDFFPNMLETNYLIEQTITEANGFFSLKIPLLKKIEQ